MIATMAVKMKVHLSNFVGWAVRQCRQFAFLNRTGARRRQQELERGHMHLPTRRVPDTMRRATVLRVHPYAAQRGRPASATVPRDAAPVRYSVLRVHGTREQRTGPSKRCRQGTSGRRHCCSQRVPHCGPERSRITPFDFTGLPMMVVLRFLTRTY